MTRSLSNADPDWMGDPAISWNIMLVLTVDGPLPEDLQERLDLLNDELSSPRWRIAEGTDEVEMARLVTHSRHSTLQLGRCPRTPTPQDPSTWTLFLSGHHSRVDGLGLLACLSRLLGVEVLAEARGLGDRSPAPGGLVSRLQEVLLRPSDVVPALGASPTDEADWFAWHRVEGAVHTSELILGALRSVERFTVRAGGRVRRPSVAVGASWVGGRPLRLGDHSALVRLTDMHDQTEATVRERLRTASPEGTTSVAPPGLVGVAVRTAMRVLRSRLGSTVQVSHLGRVHITGVGSITVHAASSGASGVAVGAVTLVRPDGSTLTTLSLRSRANRHSRAAVEQLLSFLVNALATPADR